MPRNWSWFSVTAFSRPKHLLGLCRYSFCMNLKLCWLTVGEQCGLPISLLILCSTFRAESESFCSVELDDIRLLCILILCSTFRAESEPFPTRRTLQQSFIRGQERKYRETYRMIITHNPNMHNVHPLLYMKVIDVLMLHQMLTRSNNYTDRIQGWLYKAWYVRIPKRYFGKLLTFKALSPKFQVFPSIEFTDKPTDRERGWNPNT